MSGPLYERCPEYPHPDRYCGVCRNENFVLHEGIDHPVPPAYRTDENGEVDPDEEAAYLAMFIERELEDEDKPWAKKEVA